MLWNAIFGLNSGLCFIEHMQARPVTMCQRLIVFDSSFMVVGMLGGLQSKHHTKVVNWIMITAKVAV